jgi:creatinine amidohydrolase
MSSLYDLTSPKVAEAIRRNPLAIVPFGSIEQHGPHLPCGTDTMASESIAKALAEEMDGIYVPFAPYGVTPIHAGHPGTISLSREAFETLLRDVCRESIAMGIKRFVFVNWHELNTPSLDAVATELQDAHDARFVVAQACYVAQRIYADEGGELTHGGGIETMAVMAHDPSLIEIEAAGEPTRPPGAVETDKMRRSHEVYGFVTNVREIANEGWYGDPSWATNERADGFVERVTKEIASMLTSIDPWRERG